MNLIVAVDQNWGIGFNQNLLFNLKGDMEFFKTTTMGNVVVMGDNTLFSLPNSKPLKNRINIVLSNNPSLQVENAIVVNSLPQLFKVLKKYDSNDIFVIGGSYVYHELLPYCHTAYVTLILASKPANKFFPDLSKLSNWQKINSSEILEENNIKYCFTIWENCNVKTFN